MEIPRPPRFLVSLYALVPQSTTPVGQLPLAFPGAEGAAFDRPYRLGSHHLGDFGAPYLRPVRSLSTLRSHGYPCTTQDSLPACWLSVGRAGFPPAWLIAQLTCGITSFRGLQASLAHKGLPRPDTW
jgi:hypothetical protein